MGAALARRLGVYGVILCLVAGAAYGTLRWTFGQRPVYVNVRWAPTLDPFARQILERRYELAQADAREQFTWGYALNDVSPGNIAALLNDPAVEDTHHINQAALRVDYLAERLPYRTSHRNIAVGLEIAAAFALLAAMGAFVLALLEFLWTGTVIRLNVALDVFGRPTAAFIAIAAAFILLHTVAQRGYSALLVEDGLVENATALALFAACGFFAAAARRRTGTARSVAAAFAVLLAVGAFEEISWGQRILGIPTPQFFIRHSAQSEINVHNTFQGVSSISTKHLVAGVFLLYAIVLPRLLRAGVIARRGPLKYLIVPPVALTVPLLIGVAFLADYPTENEEEIGELLLAGCLCLFGRHELRRASDVAFDLAVAKVEDAVREGGNVGLVRDDKDRIARPVEPVEQRHDLGARL
jgi:hypothetical protein